MSPKPAGQLPSGPTKTEEGVFTKDLTEEKSPQLIELDPHDVYRFSEIPGPEQHTIILHFVVLYRPGRSYHDVSATVPTERADAAVRELERLIRRATWRLQFF